MITGVTKFLAISVAIYFAIALGLILSQSPKSLKGNAQSLDFEAILDRPWMLRPPNGVEELQATFTAANGDELPEFLLIAGAEDESFIASLYQPTMEPLSTKGRYEVVPDLGHLAVVDAPETLNLIREFLR
ncbi:alpha/beta hydrolase [Alisedimentitalea sp. MJ-SS2]|uniref:alpha/beta fold hydrolase n=1 Tax=Aliisedimentitalea sp. MJ-SS2 TaxID=3049795 RepID=UPI00290A6F9E|nr:alpha/beta hydrolase [Alisedimentitalea sp. MJ-SS2]MDU8926654.1 alpha/beta hydrolase [Alisedimentitalea sp. MJ-SS2]